MTGNICFEFFVQCLCSLEAKVDPILLNKCFTRWIWINLGFYVFLCTHLKNFIWNGGPARVNCARYWTKTVIIIEVLFIFSLYRSKRESCLVYTKAQKRTVSQDTNTCIPVRVCRIRKACRPRVHKNGYPSSIHLSLTVCKSWVRWDGKFVQFCLMYFKYLLQ